MYTTSLERAIAEGYTQAHQHTHQSEQPKYTRKGAAPRLGRERRRGQTIARNRPSTANKVWSYQAIPRPWGKGGGGAFDGRRRRSMLVGNEKADWGSQNHVAWQNPTNPKLRDPV